MNNFYDELINTLKQNSEFLSNDSTLLRNKIYELAMKLDEELIELLFNNTIIKERLFKKIGSNYVFDKVEFGWIINNKEFLPDSYTRFKNKIGLATSEDSYISNSNNVALNFPFKDCLLVGGQTKEEKDRKEVFYNSILNKNDIDTLLSPKVFTNVKRFINGKEESVNKYGNESLIIKGNNLITASCLLRRFENNIDFIYLDPPYNTSGQAEIFSYNNSFKHSTWLTFMKNRLDICKQLLTDKGFVAIAIDQFELFYLGVLCDEIFGRDNRIGIVTVVHKPEGRNQEKFFATSNEFLLVYAKNKESAKFNDVILSDEKKAEYQCSDEKGKYKLNSYLRGGGGDDNLRVNKPHFWYPIYVNPTTLDVTTHDKPGYVPVYPITNSGVERTWKTKKDTFEKALQDGEIVALCENGNYIINEKYRAGELIKTHWIDKRYNAINNGTKVLQDLNIDGFSYPKSIYSVQDIINICMPSDGIVLDLFAGSGTTAHAVMNLNKDDNGDRRYIICEQMDYVENVTFERVKKVSLALKCNKPVIYCELKQANEKYIDMIKSSENTNELLNIMSILKEESYIICKVDFNNIFNNIEQFKLLTLQEQKNILTIILDKNMLYVNYSDIDDKEYKISEIEAKFSKQFYGDIDHE